ncbi:TetR/AcrR family transcriptional regulator [Flavicella sp.]|uniref:TetR/AcrR family transcriptional regulator n=1 Tax=Flavicella sp. TaxID=2957742 RepID=UPI002631DE3A|nr:TetR/AcrR family transcriptional regulator [Flavicella sp.]MDG1804423.1 TetR/AcrR family transcriptional regulator [Flavicella sp.]MDG2281214.1 TetR/AcrR family transcriptional regulator [Flavicella sp.]
MARELSHSYNELVEKAQEIFWLHGFKGISAKELAEHVGVSTSTIYNKYPKEMLFIDSLKYYTSNYSDPFLQQLRETTEGLDSLKDFFYSIIEALLDKTFPKSCLMVNTIVEMRNENRDIINKYEQYFQILTDSYKVVLRKAYNLGQIKNENSIDTYAEFLLGIIFSLSILYKIKPKDELQAYIDEQLNFIR